MKNLVEWPAPIACAFEREFLRVPQEALIMTMESNQKFFPVLDAEGRLTERFIGIANIESRNPGEVRRGYERVIRPRFADAAFFFDDDLKTPLASHQEALKKVTYQQKLGSVWDKCCRVAELARVIANRTGADGALATKAAALSRCDLMTRMVGEFPELQGTMGRYYATAQGLEASVAAAIDEFYQPRFAGDAIAASALGRVLAIAEKLDTLAGLFAIGQKPTGNKDPFSLRRNALGLARTLIEGRITLDLGAQIREAFDLARKDFERIERERVAAGGKPDPIAATHEDPAELLAFIFDRLRGYYADQGIRATPSTPCWRWNPPTSPTSTAACARWSPSASCPSPAHSPRPTSGSATSCARPPRKATSRRRTSTPPRWKWPRNARWPPRWPSRATMRSRSSPPATMSAHCASWRP